MVAPSLSLQCPRCGRPAIAAPGARCPVDGARLIGAAAAQSDPPDPLVGQCLAPGLLVYDVLSDAGGFGRVYSAVQLDLGRLVAVKLLRPGVAARSPEAHARFLQEARLLATLTHEPRIVTVHDCVVREDELVYMVLALAPGQPLSDVLGAPLAPARARHLMIEILTALDAAHQRRLVHRDLKPDNVIVHGAAPEERITLIDFGIAKVLDPAADTADAPRTRSGLALGTPRYMAPEQLQRGGQMGPWTDVYAAGVLLFEMLTGQTPFDGGPAELVGAHLYEPPPALPAAVPADLAAVVARALSKRPADRYPDAGALVAALRDQTSTPAVVRHPTATVDGVTMGVDLATARPRWPLAAAAAVLGLALFGWAVWPDDPVAGAADAGAVTAAVTPSTPVDADLPDAARLDAAPPDAAPPKLDAAPTEPDAAPPTAAPATAPPSVAARPRRAPRRTRRAPRTAPPTAAPPTAAPATAAPPKRAAADLVARIQAALRRCHCDRARALLPQARGTADHPALARAIGRCTPPLPDIGCIDRTP